jgi:hypothetical protein
MATPISVATFPRVSTTDAGLATYFPDVLTQHPSGKHPGQGSAQVGAHQVDVGDPCIVAQERALQDAGHAAHGESDEEGRHSPSKLIGHECGVVEVVQWAVVAGLKSHGNPECLRGSALGGFIVGAVLSLLNVILGNGRVYAYSWMFVIVIVILLVRPGGILSKFATKERV